MNCYYIAHINEYFSLLKGPGQSWLLFPYNIYDSINYTYQYYANQLYSFSVIYTLNIVKFNITICMLSNFYNVGIL